MNTNSTIKPGPKPEQWKKDFLAVSYFVWRCLHDETRHWTFDRITDFVWDLYAHRLTLSEFNHIRALKNSLLEFRTKTRKMQRLKQSRPNQADSREGQSGARKIREPRSTSRRSHGKV